METKLIIASLKQAIKELQYEKYQQEKNGLAKAALNFVEILETQVNGADTGNDKCHIQNVKASVLSDINKMIEKVEGWIDKDTSRRDKYLIHGQADGMRKAIHIIHQHLP